MRRASRGPIIATALALALATLALPPAAAAYGPAAARPPRATAEAELDARETWRWPVAGGIRVVAPYAAPAHAYAPGHRGVDVAAGPGADALAPASGVVAFSGTVVDRPLLTIDHGGGLVTTLEPVRSDLSPGDRVARGQVVGQVATGGHAAPGSLHLGVRLDGEYINPLLLLGGVPRAVLLPCC
jgi:murein DD-endopeptidase MepM/ murein hydrolase activator NlpD